MRHPLNWLLIAIRRDDGEAILGDLEQEYRSRLRLSLGWFGAQLWYAWELLAAAAHGIRDALNRCATGFRGLEGGHMRSMTRLFATHRGYVAMSTLKSRGPQMAGDSE